MFCCFTAPESGCGFKKKSEKMVINLEEVWNIVTQQTAVNWKTRMVGSKDTAHIMVF